MGRYICRGDGLLGYKLDVVMLEKSSTGERSRYGTLTIMHLLLPRCEQQVIHEMLMFVLH